MCRIIVSFTRVHCVGVWFGFVRLALLLAIVLFWVPRCFGSWVLLGLFCLLRATQPIMVDQTGYDWMKVKELTCPVIKALDDDSKQKYVLVGSTVRCLYACMYVCMYVCMMHVC